MAAANTTKSNHALPAVRHVHFYATCSARAFSIWCKHIDLLHGVRAAYVVDIKLLLNIGSKCRLFRLSIGGALAILEAIVWKVG